MTQGQVRFEAEWIIKQHADANGEWNPDRDEYGVSQHFTKDAAIAAAIKESKRAGQCEWLMVAEQKYVGYEWVDQRRWVGDWDGAFEETFRIEQND